jgi:hypothetical protein
MKIVLNSQIVDLFSNFLLVSKELKDNTEFINAKDEKSLFDNIVVGDVNSFIIDSSTSYAQRAIDFIKKKYPYILVILIGKSDIHKINNADIYMPEVADVSYFYSIIFKNIVNYERNFNVLKKLTVKLKNKIEFANCIYDPNLRILHYNGNFVINFSDKSGGVFEILAMNYGKLVRKELILEKVWFKNDYFSSRSMDVYVSGLRKILNKNNVDLKIKNISKTGLILQ